MPASILPTKPYIPSPRRNRVPRSHLLDCQDEALRQGHRLSLVKALPGFGKTALVTTWLYNANRPIASRSVAWLSLDEGDNDPVRLFLHLVAAFRQVDCTLGRTSQSLHAGPRLPPLHALLTSLIRDIANVDMSFVLVLDDNHLIRTPAIHLRLTVALSFSEDKLTAGRHAVVTTGSS